MNLNEDIPTLKDAISRTDANVLANDWRVILAAAKKQLAAEEAQKPKRASLEEIARCCGKHHGAGEPYFNCHDAECRVTLTDYEKLLKALRETVVPWLRSSAWAFCGTDGGRVMIDGWQNHDMLLALGEEP